MNGSTFNPRNINEFDKSNLFKFAKGVYGTATANTTTNIDYTLSDDLILAGGSICLVKDGNWGDKISLQVLSGSTVLMQFLNDWPINSTSMAQNLPTSNYPAKIPAGLTIRAIYTSTHASISPEVAIGYNFEKVLV